MSGPPKDVDGYLANVPEPQRSTLQALRRTIGEAVPDAIETISYRMPTFKLRGKYLLGMSAAKDHCSLHTMGYLPDELEADLAGYDTGKGTIRFPAEAPLPAALVRKIAKARLAQLEGTSGWRPP